MIKVLPFRHPQPLPREVLEKEAEKFDLAEYHEVCQKLGFSAGPVIAQEKGKATRHELVSFCLDNGFPIYNNEEVHTWMIKRANNDAGSSYRYVWDSVSGNSFDRHRSYFINSQAGRLGQGEFRRGYAYTRPIPLDILKRAVLIKGKFENALIWATDYEYINPDPFICVTLPNIEPVVFGAWDEPGFGLLGRDRKITTE